MEHHLLNTLKVKSLGIDTYSENIIFIRSDCHICRSEGFTALTRLVVHHNEKTIIATLNVVHSELLSGNEAGLSDIALERLNVREGDLIAVSHLKPIESLSDVRAKIYHNKINEKAYHKIISDITDGLYSDIEISAFIAGCAGNNMDLDEITWLTKAMIKTGSRLKWNQQVIADKHCVGGLPGNRTTPIIVAIIAASGLTIPKTSSRAITSPAGTADTMETITVVNLSTKKIKDVVNKEGGCFAWGSLAKLSPADDILITVEKALDIDSPGQMIASVLSKKVTAGSTHVLIEIPFGETAKVRTHDEALKLQYYFKAVGDAVKLNVEVLITDGSQPIGKGIGPALEAMDVLSVLRNEKQAPKDLKDKSLVIAGALLELSGKAEKGKGISEAKKILESGKAYEKFQKICLAQGGFKEPGFAKFHINITSETAGIVKSVDNRKLAKIAKLAGAPRDPSAGIYFNAPIGTKIEKGQTLYTIYSELERELQYAVDYLKSVNSIITIV
ncbi:putative thymidine phosphorylase [Flavobacterium limnosediminis JC2902]|uniref:thymidine phosphorylase n=1 Tax=Flavobacterium limnosediminis JC2902 TaxID=1341181 RepID=V6SH95_9FLAO|nr:thymidine phosphorylase family protein [Flavobacterium limnosediminis]ESU25819.1 putative thymidine phosphorylase [Flavobacterium limnosediminis JC2902]